MAGRWRKQLLKVVDVFVMMPFNINIWKKCNIESRILTIILPFHKSSPWKLRNARFVRECEGILQKLWKDDFLLGRYVLRKLFETARSLESLSGIIVRP